jgi:hypothetical protein
MARRPSRATAADADAAAVPVSAAWPAGPAGLATVSSRLGPSTLAVSPTFTALVAALILAPPPSSVVAASAVVAVAARRRLRGAISRGELDPVPEPVLVPVPDEGEYR